MWRKLLPEDFRQARNSMYQQAEARAWFVCDQYYLDKDEIVARISVREWEKTTEDEAEASAWSFYWPLDETPELFLRLASLYEAPRFDQAALAFCCKYGVLGNSDHVRKFDSIPLSIFQTEAKRAWTVLRLYEAVLNRSGETIRSLVSASWDDLAYWTEGYDQGLNRTWKYLQSVEFGASVERDLAFALYIVVSVVNHPVRDLCYVEAVFADEPYGVLPPLSGDPSQVRHAWKFKSLLGAMYLQMYWLITSGGELSRCEYCGRIISLSRPRPEGRKRRSDKRFCNDACRQARHREKKRASNS